MRGRIIGCIALVRMSTAYPRERASPVMAMMSGFMNGSPPVKPISRTGSLALVISSKKRAASLAVM